MTKIHFCDGVMLGMVTDNTLYFRVDDHNRAAFKEAESFPPLSYEKKGCTIDLSFWLAPERLFEEPDELVTWARAAAGGGASGRGEERTDSAKTKIKASPNLKVETQDRQGARTDDPAIDPRPRRRGDRMKSGRSGARSVIGRVIATVPPRVRRLYRSGPG